MPKKVGKRIVRSRKRDVKLFSSGQHPFSRWPTTPNSKPGLLRGTRSTMKKGLRRSGQLLLKTVKRESKFYLRPASRKGKGLKTLLHFPGSEVPISAQKKEMTFGIPGGHQKGTFPNCDRSRGSKRGGPPLKLIQSTELREVLGTAK